MQLICFKTLEILWTKYRLEQEKMKSYHLFLLLLKLAMVIQVTLILFKVQSENSITYLISELLFKVFLGLFLIMYFFIAGSPNFDFWDEVFISFGGGLLIFDAFYSVLPKILLRFNIVFNPYTFYLSTRPESAASVTQ
jgi:hypothetical protein